MSGERLTTLDSSFLWFERSGVPIHLGAVATFEAGPLLDRDGKLRIDAILDHVAARLPAVPRLRRRLAPVPLDLDRPRWVDDPDFDLARHIHEIRLPPPGDDAALRRAAEAVHSQVLPRDRPLWDLHLVTGLRGGRVGLIERIHHALADGVSGAELAALLLDPTPDSTGGRPRAAPDGWSPEPTPSPESLVGEGVRNQVTAPLRALGTLVEAARHPARALRAAATVEEGLSTAVGNGLLAPDAPFNTPPEGARRLDWLRVPLDVVRAAGTGAGASVNDVVLAAVCGGLRALLLERGETLPPDLVLKALVPVSLRAGGDSPRLGNEVSALLAPLPVGIGDPQVRLATVAATMRRLKDRPEADAFGMLLGAADTVPAPAARALVRALDRQRLVNLVVTNIPGPPQPLYMLGARMLEAVPVVPLGANLSLGVAVLSYDGGLTVSVTTDAANCPEIEVVAAGIARGFDQLGC